MRKISAIKNDNHISLHTHKHILINNVSVHEFQQRFNET